MCSGMCNRLERIKRLFNDRNKSAERNGGEKADGTKNIEFRFRFKNEQALIAVAAIMEDIKNLNSLKDVEVIDKHVNWLGGYISALYITDMVDEEQKEQLLKMIEISLTHSIRASSMSITSGNGRD